MTKLKGDPSLIANHFPPELKKILASMQDAGFQVVLVGGPVRDFLLTGKLVEDLDFEIRLEQNLEETEWKMKLKNFFESSDLNVEVLSFQVYRINVGEFELEFSSPREEVYPTEGPYGHSDFQARFYSQLDFVKAYERRDFTINAMGIIFEGKDFEGRLVDPFSGLEDLKLKKLVPIAKNFYFDPVRILRWLRFSIRDGYAIAISEADQKQLEHYNFNKLTPFYFLQEWLKSGSSDFYVEFLRWHHKYQFILPDYFLKNPLQQDFSFVDKNQFIWQVIDQDILKNQNQYFGATLGFKTKNLEVLRMVKCLCSSEQVCSPAELKKIRARFDQLKAFYEMIPDNVKKMIDGS